MFSAGSLEQKNLAAELPHAERVAAMRSLLAAWMSEQGDTQKVFSEPRLLADPAATRPGADASQ